MSESAEVELAAIEAEVRSVMQRGIAERLGRPSEQLDETAMFTALGLDSVQLFELGGELMDRYDVVLEDYATYEFPTPAKLAGHVAKLVLARRAGAPR